MGGSQGTTSLSKCSMNNLDSPNMVELPIEISLKYNTMKCISYLTGKKLALFGSDSANMGSKHFYIGGDIYIEVYFTGF